MGTTYKVNITEYPGDVATLKGYFLQVAKSVAGANGSSPTYTVVYSAHESAPNTGVQWQETYGLNWMTEVPNPGATVTCTGQWQQCALGTSYDLTADGEWSLDTSDPNAQANAVNVGKNNYVDSSGNLIPVNIVVGVQGQSTNEWNPPLIGGASGQYTPLQYVELFYNSNSVSSSMISKQETEAKEFDMSTSNPHYFWYDAATATWYDGPVPFPNTPPTTPKPQ